MAQHQNDDVESEKRALKEELEHAQSQVEDKDRLVEDLRLELKCNTIKTRARRVTQQEVIDLTKQVNKMSEFFERQARVQGVDVAASKKPPPGVPVSALTPKKLGPSAAVLAGLAEQAEKAKKEAEEKLQAALRAAEEAQRKAEEAQSSRARLSAENKALQEETAKLTSEWQLLAKSAEQIAAEKEEKERMVAEATRVAAEAQLAAQQLKQISDELAHQKEELTNQKEAGEQEAEQSKKQAEAELIMIKNALAQMLSTQEQDRVDREALKDQLSTTVSVLREQNRELQIKVSGLTKSVAEEQSKRVIFEKLAATHALRIAEYVNKDGIKESAISCKGELYSLGLDLKLMSTKKRFVWLVGTQLRIASNSNQSLAKHEIIVLGAKSIFAIEELNAETHGYPPKGPHNDTAFSQMFAFAVLPAANSRKYVFVANTENERGAWLTALRLLTSASQNSEAIDVNRFQLKRNEGGKNLMVVLDGAQGKTISPQISPRDSGKTPKGSLKKKSWFG